MKIESLLNEIEQLFKEVNNKEEYHYLWNVVDNWVNNFQSGIGVINDIAEERNYYEDLEDIKYII